MLSRSVFMVSAHFSFEMCVAVWSRKKLTKTPYFWVQGHSRWSMLILPESSSAVLVIISHKPVPVCNRSHAKRFTSGKLSIFSGTSFWCPCLRGVALPNDAKFGHKKLETLRCHTAKTRTLYLTWAWFHTLTWQTNKRTELRRLVRP